MEQQKILIALPSDQLGGAEQLLKMIASYYASNGADVTVYIGSRQKYNGWDDISDHPGINIYYHNSGVAGGITGFYSYLRKLNKTYFDLAWSSNVYYTGLLGFYRKTGVLKVKSLVGRESTSIFIRYSGWKLMIYRFFYNLGYSNVDLLICQTGLMKDQLIRGIPRIASKIKIKVLHNPIDLASITRQSAEGEVSFYKEGRKYIVSAGRFIVEKGFDILIKAFKPVSEEYPDIDLMILGDGALMDELKELVNTLNLAGRVILPGRVNNVYPYFKLAELCVVSSRIEGFPNVLLQMMSQNGNVVSTTCAGGVADIPGLLTCEPGDEELILELMRKILNTPAAEKDKRFEEFCNYLKQNSIESFTNSIHKELVS